MASQVHEDGSVVPPLNITAPAPILNLRGFKWRTVDAKILGPQPEQRHEQHEQPEEHISAQEAFQPAGQAVSAQVPAAPAPPAPPAPAAPALPAPQLPHAEAAFATQLPGQLRLQLAPEAAPFPLAQFQGAYAGNGFNMIFRPRPAKDKTEFPTPPAKGDPTDNILELNLTTEQLTFGGTIGEIPNRGLIFNGQPDIFLAGLPYLQTVQDVTNIDTGKGDSPSPTGIHFEPGMWLSVPECISNPKNGASVVRMASIPHGTTINAQGLAPQQVTTTRLGGAPGPPTLDILDTTPFQLGNFNKKVNPNPFRSMTAENADTPRIPQNLQNFINSGTITTAIIRNPNLVLQNVINDQTIIENISFEVTTGPSTGPFSAKLNGGGTTNISFLAGTQSPITTASPVIGNMPNAHADFMTSKFWIETVAYQVVVPRLTTTDRVLLKPTMPKGSSAPTPVFVITPPPTVHTTPVESKTITIPGIQIQYSQTVNLNFGPPGDPAKQPPGILTWPHVSVATLVPSDPQPFTLT